MLNKYSLYELVKSLTLLEKKYLVSKGKKGTEKENAYIYLLKLIDSMDIYSEDLFKKEFSVISKSEKTDVKKHYLYYWILKNLADYHSRNYSEYNELKNVLVLIERSLVNHAILLVPTLKKRLLKLERYTNLLTLLEIELKIQKYSKKDNSEKILQELNYYTSIYADLQILEYHKFKFRKILDYNMFSRTEEEKNLINELFKTKILAAKVNSKVFLINYNYNILHYWKNATENNWKIALKYALKNLKALEENPEIAKENPEVSVKIIYNLLSTASISNNKIYGFALEKLKKQIKSIKNLHSKKDALFYMHVSTLINYNHKNHYSLNNNFITEADKFIESNKEYFSRIKLNNYYFDLAKSYYYQNNFLRAFQLLNEIYQNLNIIGHTIDFYTNSRILFCLTCYELDEINLMKNTAKSITEFMKRNKVYYEFEKRFVKFIINDLSGIKYKSRKIKINLLENLKKDLELIYKSEYEIKVLNYFDYFSWVNNKIENLQN